MSHRGPVLAQSKGNLGIRLDMPAIVPRKVFSCSGIFLVKAFVAIEKGITSR